MPDIPSGLLSALAETPGIARTLLRGEDGAAPSGAAIGEWPATVILAHLADVDAFMLANLERVLGDSDATVGDFDPMRTEERAEVWALGLTAALDRFAGSRARYVARLEQLSADDWARTVIHEHAGPLTIASFTGRILYHDVAHIAQICRRIG